MNATAGNLKSGILHDMSSVSGRRSWLIIASAYGLAIFGCGGDKTPPGDIDAPPGAVDAPIKVDAPEAGMTMVTWSLLRNGVATTCAGVDPANPDIKISFFQADVNRQIQRVPCSDGSAIINVPPGTYRMALNLAPAGDPTKSGMEYSSQEVVIPAQGITAAAELAQANVNFTWVPATIPACTGAAKLSMKIDKTTVINVTCTLGSAMAAVPAGSKAAAIVIGVTTFAKTLTIPRAGGTVALPLP